MGYTEDEMPLIRFANRLDRHVDYPNQDVDGDTLLSTLLAFFSDFKQDK